MKTKHFLYFSMIGLSMSYCFSADQFSEIRQFRSEMNLLRERIGRNLDSMDSRMEKLKRTFEDPNWKKKQAQPQVQQTNFTPSKPRPSIPPPTANNRTIPPAIRSGNHHFHSTFTYLNAAFSNDSYCSLRQPMEVKKRNEYYECRL